MQFVVIFAFGSSPTNGNKAKLAGAKKVRGGSAQLLQLAERESISISNSLRYTQENVHFS